MSFLFKRLALKPFISLKDKDLKEYLLLVAFNSLFVFLCLGHSDGSYQPPSRPWLGHNEKNAYKISYQPACKWTYLYVVKGNSFYLSMFLSVIFKGELFCFFGFMKKEKYKKPPEAVLYLTLFP